MIAYKYDLIKTDLVCLDFHSPASDLLVHEEMPGWDKLTSELTQHLPGATPYEDWWPLVVEPAFKRCEQVVFEINRSAAQRSTAAETS